MVLFPHSWGDYRGGPIRATKRGGEFPFRGRRFLGGGVELRAAALTLRARTGLALHLLLHLLLRLFNSVVLHNAFVGG